MKLKELESILSQVDSFETPKIELEQYKTSAHIASRLLYTMHNSFDEVEDKIVVDLGCGGGILGLGACILGCGHCIGVDIDQDALDIAMRNREDFDLEEDIDFVHADIRAETLPFHEDFQADVVVTNPPFGTRSKGADMDFLRAGARLASTAIYSLHKKSTRDYIAKFASRELGAKSAEVLAELRYDLPSTYKFHKKASMDIEVDLWRIGFL